jgi:hypothetical protein
MKIEKYKTNIRAQFYINKSCKTNPVSGEKQNTPIFLDYKN